MLILCFIIPTTVEYLTGVIMRTYFNKNYWDYSKIKYNFQGIICIKFSIYWTILTFIGINYFQVYIVDTLYNLISPFSFILLFILMKLLIIDEIFTLRAFKRLSIRP
jgi:uncharacterized membrane protein